ncbi:amino acid adenylation domain-containing protein [Kitasatospora sp. NPDC057015]|uniref:non-ribosomal peptide synthetase n=1 Tax=Kitasatospora sp. NPDC057015 TaxID=3346001 RepID=UPI00362AE620
MNHQSPERTTTTASAAQQGVWLTERLGAAGDTYHMPVLISFDSIDTAALTAACAAVVARHPGLASSFAERDGRIELRHHEQPFTVSEIDARTDGPDSLAKRLAEECGRPFALDAGPLVRFTLLHGPRGRADLLVVAHHAVFDGMSKDVLVADLAAAYNALVAGRPLPIGVPGAAPASPSAPAEELLREAAAWFGPHWSDPAEVLLPGGRRTVRGAGPGEQVTRRIDHTALADAAARAGVTGFEFLLTAVHALLRRYGNADTPVAVSMSTRTPELAAETGCFVNELPHHAPEPAAGASFAAFAAGVRGRLRELYRFRSVPFGAAVGGLSPRVGLTPVSLGYRRRGAEPRFDGTGSRVDWMVFNRTARNTLHIQVVDADDSCTVSLQYDPAVIPSEDARRISRQLDTLLGAAVADPAAPLDELPLLDSEEHRLVTEAFNDTERSYPADRTVVDLFDERAAASPDVVAVAMGGRTLTYRELRERSTALAGRLTALGVGRGDLVALYLERTAELPVALLGVLRTGAGYLPLDPGYPVDRLAFVLADSGAALLLANREPAPEVAAAAPAVLRLDAGAADGAGPDAAADPAGLEAPAARPGPADTAYVLYTSGSTGRPKGVAVGHRALVNLLTSFAGRLGSGAQDVWLGLTSLSFDISALEIYLPLITGGRLVPAPDGLAVDGPGLLELIGREGVTHVQATPSGWRVLLGADPGRTALTALVGGEALPLPLARELRGAVARLFNVYGPTETTIWSTCAEIPADPESVTIGRPIANTRAHVLDELRRPLPIGVPGELYLGGDGVAQGYLGRPELTAERFVEDPYGPDGARRYRTGDLAAWTADGELDFLGRIDNQVKIRGHRIELGEIEARLLEHPAVAEAAVTVIEDPAGDPRLIGYLVSAGPAPAAAELREHLLRTMPAAMVPQVFVPLPAMPLTPNGKLDRRALPAPEPAATTEDTPVGPAAEAGDPVEAGLREIWSEVLGIPEIGLDEDLFDLGGHSLTIIQISARIRKAFGVDVDFDVFFDFPTVAGIAAAVKELL